MTRVALATSENWPRLSPDDAELIPELARLGIDASPAVWSDGSADWKRFDAVIIRSCWDYHLRRDEFLQWIESLDRVYNPPTIVRWNSHKSYLRDLATRGVAIPNTQLIRSARERITIDGEVIVKPAVSASAYDTFRLTDRAAAATTIERLLSRGDVIVQEFIPEIATVGEWSLIFFDRVYSHAVRKMPMKGDFRVQTELGGSSMFADASDDLIAATRHVLDTIDGDLLYARVDVVQRADTVTLMELELIEPMLFLVGEPFAAKRFAQAIARRVGGFA